MYDTLKCIYAFVGFIFVWKALHILILLFLLGLYILFNTSSSFMFPQKQQSVSFVL